MVPMYAARVERVGHRPLVFGLLQSCQRVPYLGRFAQRDAEERPTREAHGNAHTVT